MFFLKEKCKFNAGMTCPIYVMKKRTCCFKDIPLAMNEKLAYFIYCLFNGTYIHSDEAVEYDACLEKIKKSKMWCNLDNITGVCSDFASEVLRAIFNIQTCGEDIQHFNFQTSTHETINLKRVCSESGLYRLKSGSLLFLINKELYMTPNPSIFTVDSDLQDMNASSFHDNEVTASHVLFYLGQIKDNIYVGGANHTSHYQYGVVPVRSFFHFQNDFVWTFNSNTLYGLFAWEVK